MADPTAVILAPWEQLGIAGSVVVALGVVCWLQWQHIKEVTAAHLADIKAYGDRFADLLSKVTDTNEKLANAVERLGDRIK